jgi:hypothetical protein
MILERKKDSYLLTKNLSEETVVVCYSARATKTFLVGDSFLSRARLDTAPAHASARATQRLRFPARCNQ